MRLLIVTNALQTPAEFLIARWIWTCLPIRAGATLIRIVAMLLLLATMWMTLVATENAAGFCVRPMAELAVVWVSAGAGGTPTLALLTTTSTGWPPPAALFEISTSPGPLMASAATV